MYAFRWPTSVRLLTRLAGIALVVFATMVALNTAAAPARAATTDQVLSSSVQEFQLYKQPWYKGGAAYAEGSATWTRTTNLLEVTGKARSTSSFGGAFAKVIVHFYASIFGFEFEAPIARSFDIPTACSTTDTCASTTHLRDYAVDVVPAEAKSYISSIHVEVARR